MDHMVKGVEALSRTAGSLKSLPQHHRSEAEEVERTLRPYAVGIDVHKRFIQVCVLIPRGTQITRKEREFSTDYDDLKLAKRWALHVLGGLANAKTLEYTLESTGCYHHPVMLAWSAVPSIVNPLLANPSRRKTDVLDARLLASQSLTGMWPASYKIPLAVQEVRVLINHRREKARRANRANNQIGNYMLRWGHTFLAHQTTRDGVGSAVIDDLLAGRWPRHPGVAPRSIPDEVRAVLAELVEDQRKAVRDVKVLTDRAYRRASEIMWPIATGEMVPGSRLLCNLQTVPGVGRVAALTWLVEVVDPRRFPSARAVAAYAGCDPSLKVSAGKVTEHKRRRGNGYLHKAMVVAAASVVRRRDGKLGEWGAAIRGRQAKGGWAKACGAVARRIAASCWWVHQKNEPYDDSAYRIGERPHVRPVALTEYPELKRWWKALEQAGLRTTADCVELFYGGCNPEGIGARCRSELKQILTSLVVSRFRGVFVEEPAAPLS